jgi:hypothetical protein
MRKISVITLALTGLLMVGAMTASSALATTPQILANGKTITELLFLQLSGEALLEDTKASILGNPDLLCSGIYNGMIEPGGASGFVEELLMLSGELLNEAGVLNGAGNDMIDCTDHNSLCSKGETEEVLETALNLPWHMRVGLLEIGGKDVYIGETLREAGKVPAEEITCETALGTLKDICEVEEGTTSDALLENTAGGVLGELTEKDKAEGGITEAEKCSIGGSKTALQSGDSFITESGSAKEALTVSE